MKNSLKKCLVAGLLFPLTACAHYYQGQSGYYPNTGGYGGGWQRGYYGNGPSNYYNYNNRSYGNFPNYRQQYIPAVPRRDHDDWRHEPRHDHQEWNNRYGDNHFQQGDHERHNGNAWQQHRGPESGSPNYQKPDHGNNNNNRGDHQGWGNNGFGQSDHHRRDHDRD